MKIYARTKLKNVNYHSCSKIYVFNFHDNYSKLLIIILNSILNLVY